MAAEALVAAAGDYSAGNLRRYELRLCTRASSAMGSTPVEISNTLAFLQIDLTDPEFHRLALASSGSVHAGIRALVKDALAAGELTRCNADRLAHALQAAMNGSLLNWAIHRKGTLQQWIRRDLKTVLAPYILRKAKKRRAL